MSSKAGVKWKQVCITKQKSVTWKLQVIVAMVWQGHYSDYALFLTPSPLLFWKSLGLPFSSVAWSSYIRLALLGIHYLITPKLSSPLLCSSSSSTVAPQWISSFLIIFSFPPRFTFLHCQQNLSASFPAPVCRLTLSQMRSFFRTSGAHSWPFCSWFNNLYHLTENWLLTLTNFPTERSWRRLKHFPKYRWQWHCFHLKS